MNRRYFLGTAAALTISQGLSACTGAASDSSVRVALLEHTIPDQLIRTFRRQFEGNVPVTFLAAEQLSALYSQLLSAQSKTPNTEPDKSQSQNFLSRFWRRPSDPADLISLGDYWLTAAIRQKLILPLETDGLSHWSTLPPRWQALVRRDAAGQPSAGGFIWGAPYRWGSLMMVYRDRPFQALGWTPTDWADLWRPELAGQIALPNNPRLILGIVLKKLGLSANPSNLTTQLPEIESDIRTLHQQVRFYSSDHYLQALATDGISLAVGWSTDILPVLQSYRAFRIATPMSGTLLSADVWVKPATTQQSQRQFTTPHPLSPALGKWVDFLWEAQVATQLSVSNQGTSPLYTSRDAPDLPTPLQANRALLPTHALYEQSEFLTWLSDADQTQYRDFLNQLSNISNQPSGSRV